MVSTRTEAHVKDGVSISDLIALYHSLAAAYLPIERAGIFVNRTGIAWTPKIIAEQLERNAQRDCRLRQAEPRMIRDSISNPVRPAKVKGKKVAKVRVEKKVKKQKPPPREKVARTHNRPTKHPVQPIPKGFEHMIVRGGHCPLPSDMNGIAKAAGFVYLIECRGLHKIGMTNSIPRRMRELEKKWRMDKYEIVHVITSDDMIYLEATLHRRYIDKCVHAEWFNLTSDDVAWIVRLGKTINGMDVLLLAA